MVFDFLRGIQPSNTLNTKSSEQNTGIKRNTKTKQRAEI